MTIMNIPLKGGENTGKKIEYPEGIEVPDLKGKMGVYVVTNVITGKKYVGQSKDIQRRWYDHRSKSQHPRDKDEYNSLFYQAIREYGIENFYIDILEECSEEELEDKEIYWINKLNTFYNGYNNDFGGHLACYTKEHHMTDHGRARLTIGEVKMCRQAYKNGERARDVYEKYFSHKISWAGFERMWHGKNWKTVMPEVFANKPHPAQKVTSEQIQDIRKRFDKGEGCRSITRAYKGTLSYGTIYNIAHRKTYADGIHYSSDVSTISEESSQAIGTPDETGISESG